INSVIVGLTTQTVKEIEGNLILEFHVDERIGNKEASNFTVEAKHSSNNKYLSNKTTSINQNARVTTVVLAIPWLFQTTIPGYSQRTNSQPRGATPRPLKK
ncbi:3196_t:CDS:2, partial [Gigaspora rosea]